MTGRATRRRFLGAAAVTILSNPLRARADAASPQPLRVIVFPGGFNLPLWVAQEQGYFAGGALAVELTPTPSSTFQLTHLIGGEFDIAMTAMDNVIAYDEGQGEVQVHGNPDLFAFMGGDSGFLRLIVTPEIRTYADLRGKVLSVDALSTGYAFVLRKMLEANGLGPADYTLVPAGGVLERWQALLRGEHAGTLLVTPFEVLAQERGFRLLGNALDVLHQYQGVVGAARRSWATAHRDALVGFIGAYRDALTWLYSPWNRDEGIQILGRNANFPSALAQKAFDILVDPFAGFAPAAAPDLEGIRTVLDLRSEFAVPRKTFGGPLAYVDLRYYLAP